MLSPRTVESILAKLKWCEAELKLLIVEDGETAADLQSIIEKIQEAIVVIQTAKIAGGFPT